MQTSTLLSLAALPILAACSREAGPLPEPPRFEPSIDANLLVISLDTTRADHLSCYGYERETTPRIDELARTGHRFKNALTVMPTTLPSHSAMFTSRYPRQLGVLNNLDTLADEEVTLAERLRDAGFATGAFISARPLGPETGIGQGFETFEASKRPIWRANRMRNLARKWIKSQVDASQRFFCFVHMFDAHVPYDAPAEHARLFAAPEDEARPGITNIAFVQTPEQITPELCRESIDAYDAEIHFMDTEVGNLIDDLRRFGQLDNTIVVVLSDHGETLDELFDEYGYAFDHGEFLYPREIRIPLIMSIPDTLLPGAGTHSEMVSTLDLMPTLLELLGVPCSGPVEGRSLFPLLANAEAPPSMTIVSERHRFVDEPPEVMRGGEFAVVMDPWYSVLSAARGNALYQLQDDPDGTTDRAEDESDKLQRLLERLDRWLSLKRRGAGAGMADDERRSVLNSLGYSDGG